jgi:hypothetical protein
MKNVYQHIFLFGVVEELLIFMLNSDRGISRYVPCVSTAKSTIN